MMRQRLSTIGVILLVSAITVAGLGACARSAEVRDTPVPASDDTGGTGGTGGEAATPAPGETVVSAVTPVTPGAEDQPTEVPADQPQPTAVVGATAAITQPAPISGGDGSIQHTVQPGETLSSIAQRYGTTVEALMQANALNSTSQIYAGQVLTIPASSGLSGGSSGGRQGCRFQHTVQSGEWVWQIARNYGVSPYDILALNGLTVQSAQTIYPGTVLCIP